MLLSATKNKSESNDVQCIIDPVKIAILRMFVSVPQFAVQTNRTPIFAIGTSQDGAITRPGLNDPGIERNVAEGADLHVESHQ